MIWALFALMALAVVAALLWPLLRTPTVPAERSAYDMTVFRDQLAEVDRDLARGVLTASEADAARLEIQRRLLNASKLATAPVRSETQTTRTLLSVSMAVAVPFIALALYFTVGAPQLPAGGRPQAASRTADPEVAALVEKLAARMKEQPNNPEGWSLLARSYRQMERYADAAEAYRNVMRLVPDDAGAYAGYAEASVGAAGGTVSAEARDALVKALQLNRDEPSAKFYLGLERAQAGDAKGALAIWRDLTASAPADAPWLNMVRGQMAQVAQDAGIPPMSVQPRHALEVIGAEAAPAPQTATTDPASPDVSAIKGRFSSENLEMIQGMVGGLQAKLADNPNDYNGWMLLGRSMTVLKNTDGAKNAYQKAIALKPTEAAPKVQLAELLATDGDKGGARKLLNEALTALPANAPDRADIARRLETLK